MRVRETVSAIDTTWVVGYPAIFKDYPTNAYSQVMEMWAWLSENMLLV